MLEKVFDQLPDATWLYPGHGKDTTLEPSGRTWRSGASGAGEPWLRFDSDHTGDLGRIVREFRPLPGPISTTSPDSPASSFARCSPIPALTSAGPASYA